jgi:hypothetical protein
MAIKTQFTDIDVVSFVETLDNQQKKEDSYQLISLMEQATGEKATMFGPTIIGFGKYHYKNQDTKVKLHYLVFLLAKLLFLYMFIQVLQIKMNLFLSLENSKWENPVSTSKNSTILI